MAEVGFNKRAVVFKMKIDRLDPDGTVSWQYIDGHPEWAGTRVIFARRRTRLSCTSVTAVGSLPTAT